MSGHSKWSTIKRKKGIEDAKRGKIFTKLIKEMTVAAKEGGGDESSNPRLRSAISAAKSANMPASNIDKAIKRGTGELPGIVYEEAVYEGYGPGGAALLMFTLTDNKNRTVSELRHLLTKADGSLAGPGSVAWIFESKGIIRILKEDVDEDDVFTVAVDAGAEDIQMEDDMYEIITTPENYDSVKSALDSAGIDLDSSELTQLPSNSKKIEGADARKFLHLMERIEAHDDIQHVYSNFDIDESVIEELASV
ncbi:MAG: YebC/PmpR family DNA-binding transcriptional regulator [Candidatus Marinimicrobia bacterium]|nr:YebC/PmpR family DNA-binding transcriptional regulator [Candidatus Neomarinimicrobiota bacterium]